MSSLHSHVRASLRARIFVVWRDVIHVVHDVDRVRLKLDWWFRAMGVQSVAAPPNSVAGVAARHLVSMNFDDLAS